MANESIKDKVWDYYQKHTGRNPDRWLYPSDVADALDLDAWEVFEASQELTEEGKLE